MYSLVALVSIFIDLVYLQNTIFILLVYMSHAQDTEIYDKLMRVIIIKMELAYNRHTLENGLVIVLRKVILLSLCVCVKYTTGIRKSMC